MPRSAIRSASCRIIGIVDGRLLRKIERPERQRGEARLQFAVEVQDLCSLLELAEHTPARRRADDHVRQRSRTAATISR